jgi:hypothetical protein
LDPHHFNANADPDQAFHLNADPDPDPAFHFNAKIRILLLIEVLKESSTAGFEPPGLHFERLRLQIDSLSGFSFSF